MFVAIFAIYHKLPSGHKLFFLYIKYACPSQMTKVSFSLGIYGIWLEVQVLVICL